MTAPTRTLERSLLRDGHELLAGMDEVGRGALAGPVTVGVVVVDRDTGRMPAGVRDSKLLRPQARQQLVGPVRAWARAYGVGHASPEEIDEHGIVAALCLAGHRGLEQVAGRGVVPDLVLLDGVHDWLSAGAPLPLPVRTPKVRVEPKGDLRIAAIAAASILAKTERDEIMADHHRHHPEFGWESNKGYAAPAHIEALRRSGPTPLHRRSWNLPTGPEPVQPSLLEGL